MLLGVLYSLERSVGLNEVMSFDQKLLTFLYVKCVRIRSSGLYFPVFGLNTEYLSAFSPNAGRYGPE